MNERIRELMLQAGYAAPELAGRANILAELIVRECVEILGTYEDYWNHYEQMEMLKKHFGVE